MLESLIRRQTPSEPISAVSLVLPPSTDRHSRRTWETSAARSRRSQLQTRGRVSSLRPIASGPDWDGEYDGIAGRRSQHSCRGRSDWVRVSESETLESVGVWATFVNDNDPDESEGRVIATAEAGGDESVLLNRVVRLWSVNSPESTGVGWRCTTARSLQLRGPSRCHNPLQRTAACPSCQPPRAMALRLVCRQVLRLRVNRSIII